MSVVTTQELALGAQMAQMRQQAVQQATKIYSVRGSGSIGGRLFHEKFSNGAENVLARKYIDEILYADLDLIRSTLRPTVRSLISKGTISQLLVQEWVDWATNVFAITYAFNRAATKGITSWEEVNGLLHSLTSDYITATYSRYAKERKLLNTDLEELPKYCQTYCLTVKGVYDLIDTIRPIVLTG